MPRRTIDFSKNGYYHIYNRGAGRLPIIREERNYAYLLRLLGKISRESNVTVAAYCILPNHYHWILRQDGDISAGKVPTRVFGSYSQAFNHAYERTGTLFEGPFKAKEIETEEYLMHLCRYIHLNPVKHGLVDRPEHWPYSDYLEWVGMRRSSLIDQRVVSDMFESPLGYQLFCESFLNAAGASRKL